MKIEPKHTNRPWIKRSKARLYAGAVSQKVFDRWLREGLPHVRKIVGTRRGKKGEAEPIFRIFVHPDDIDCWMQNFRVDESNADAIVDELMRGLK